ncbi:hypothetical protein AGLY_016387 [Aphis glycines]|uniref:Transmembrane protein n=1 Tax=Aphis glycines TaxID=307491 RepID=A0A6G0SXU6_APHGL|nr:hypothetical protein AGLY_016387 [Aphis glycines]
MLFLNANNVGCADDKHFFITSIFVFHVLNCLLLVLLLYYSVDIQYLQSYFFLLFSSNKFFANQMDMLAKKKIPFYCTAYTCTRKIINPSFAFITNNLAISGVFQFIDSVNIIMTTCHHIPTTFSIFKHIINYSCAYSYFLILESPVNSLNMHISIYSCMKTMTVSPRFNTSTIIINKINSVIISRQLARSTCQVQYNLCFGCFISTIHALKKLSAISDMNTLGCNCPVNNSWLR